MGIMGSTEKSGHSFLWSKICNMRQCGLKLLAKRLDSAIAKGLEDFVR